MKYIITICLLLSVFLFSSCFKSEFDNDLLPGSKNEDSFTIQFHISNPQTGYYYGVNGENLGNTWTNTGAYLAPVDLCLDRIDIYTSILTNISLYFYVERTALVNSIYLGDTNQISKEFNNEFRSGSYFSIFTSMGGTSEIDITLVFSKECD